MNEIEMVPSRTSPRRRITTGAVVLALALVVGSVAVLAGRSGTKSQAVLPLLPAAAGVAPASPVAGASSAQSQAAVAPGYYPQPLTYRLQGTLPALASHAPAYRLDSGLTEAAVATLARALGLTAAVKSGPTGWTVADGARRLFVPNQNAGQWSYSADSWNSCGHSVGAPGAGPAGMECMTSGSGFATAAGGGTASGTATAAAAGRAIAGAATTTIVGPSPGGSQPARGLPNQASPAQGVPPTGPTLQPGELVVPPVAGHCPMPPCPVGSACPSCAVPTRSAGLATTAQASQEARDLLAKAGVDMRGADVKVFAEPTADLVTVNPAVDGLPTDGMSFLVSFGPKGVVQYASGVLAGPSKLGDYPLVGTAEGFKRLQAGRGLLQGGIRPMMAAGGTMGAADGAPSRQVSITGAHLVLVRVSAADGRTYLEPAYLFETTFPAFAPPVAAVADRLLQIAPVNGPGVLVPQPAPAPAGTRVGVPPAARIGPGPVATSK